MELRDQLQSTLGSAYTLERELGGGGMSRVFVAEETALGRKIVVKVLPGETAATVSVERFKREIQVAARLQHPHIVPLLSAGEAGGLPFYTMPFVKGETLRARLSRSGELSLNEAVHILHDVAAALAYAHAEGVVHRDVKPENIMLSGGVAVVTDFGVAKAVSDSTSPGASGLTSLGATLGTPAYMAPEQASADPMIDHRADIYAFGVMAYEILTGRPLFAGRPPQAMMAAHVTEVPEPLTKRRPSVPASLATLIMRCLEKRAADRPQNAAEIVQALDAIVILSGGQLPASRFRASSLGGHIWSRSSARAAAAVLVIVIGAMALSLWRARSGSTSEVKSIAVLPFANLSGAKENEFFSEGMTEEITDALGKVPGLRVAARTSAATAAARGLDLRRVGQELSVGSVLQGSIQRVGDRVRISAQLVDAANGFQVWSGKYDNELKDIFQVQDTIAKAIVNALRIKLAGGAATTIVRVSTENPEAHTLYLQGLYLWNRRTAPTIRQAISFFQQAIEKDPRYAQAYAGIAMGYVLLPSYADLSAADALAKAKEAASRALALDSTVAEAYAVIGLAESSLWRNPSAERAYRRAIQLDSTFATAHHWYATHLAHVGRYDDAVSEIQHAHDLDPQSRIIGADVGLVLHQARRNAEAESALRKVIEFDPSFASAHRSLAMVLLVQGRYDDAVAAAQRSIELFGERQSFNVALLATAYALGRHTAEARALLEELVARSARGPVSGTGMALIYNALGDRERALQWLKRAVTEYDRSLRLFSRSPLLDRLRADPRGAALFARAEAMNDAPERRE